MTTSRSIFRGPALAVALLCCLCATAAGAQTSLVVNRLQIISAAGSATANCLGLRNALAAITDATDTNPYTLRLEPGEYACGDNTVIMKGHVDIEGSGEGVTRVYGTLDADFIGVIHMADQSELRFLTVESPEDLEKDRVAVSADSGTSRIVHAQLIAGDGDLSSCGLFVDTGATVQVHDSVLEGVVDGIFVESGATAVLAHSQLVGSYDGTGSLTCLFSYDGSLDVLDSGCDPVAP